MVIRLTEEDHAQVSAAVAEAERHSDGEIVTIVAGQSDSYHDVGLHYAVLAILLVPALLAAAPESTVAWALAPLSDWNGELQHGAALVALFVAQAIIFLIVRYALAWMPLRMALTPGATKSRRVRRRAVEIFRTSAANRTIGRTGVLLYLSMAEHRAEIVADEAIASQVEAEVWGDAMAALIEEVRADRPGEGMVRAVGKIGEVLSRFLPKSDTDTNELCDRLIEL